MNFSLIRIVQILQLFAAFVATSVVAQTKSPNVLFLAVDDLKPLLGCYGDETAITPNIDRLAKRGTVFTNAHCQWPVCGPSRASLMTSLYPEAVGVMDLKTDMREKNPNVLTLPQHFKNSGYTTVGAGKIYDPRCVDSKKTLDAPSWSLPYATLPLSKILHGDSKQVTLAPDVKDNQLTDGQICLSGRKLMKDLAGQETPFFLAVGFKKPHLPFIAPKKYWDFYDPAELKFAKHTGGIDNASGYDLHDSPEFRGYEGVPAEGPVSKELARKSLHGYYACVSFVDAQIGRLLRDLDELGLSGETIIVLWGDHGFHLGDHSMWGKHSVLEQATRSPLIVVPPAGSKVKATDTPVEFTDIFPTLCDLAGIDVPGEMAGRSLIPVIDGTRESVREGALTVFNKKGAVGYSYRTQTHRYTEWLNKLGKTIAVDLFEYTTDPLETKNLAGNPDQVALIKELSASLRKNAPGCDRLELQKQ